MIPSQTGFLFTSRRNRYSHRSGIVIQNFPESLFTSSGFHTAHKLARIIFPPDHNWSRPDVYDGGLREPGLLGHEPRAPVRTVDRHRLQRSRDHVLDLGVRN
jgi:hypothetical protein